MKSVLYLLYPLAGTILLESLAAFVMGLRGKKEYLLLALVNGVTNPFVVVLTALTESAPVTYGLLEPLAILIEYNILRKYLAGPRIGRLVIVCNCISMLGGIIWLKLLN
ncbi:MAG: hypothetical protein IIY53_10115 [Solobacterium sp.]|nr:hypothetical protein [Solobacterium sp.]